MSIIEGDDNILLLTRELADQRFKATKKKKGSNDFSCEVLGFVYSFDEQKGRAVSCYIAEVFVDREVRGQGLGELLLIAALSRALARGVSQAHLLVATQNFPAVALYKKHGFIGCSEDSGDVTHDLVMRLSTQENFFDKQLVLLLVRN
jgi:ribosomal protein S18 acetylase RimI-like enzyme